MTTLENNECTTGRQAVRNFTEREKQSSENRARFAIDMGGILKIPATQAAIMILRLDNAGYEIRPKVDNV